MTKSMNTKEVFGIRKFGKLTGSARLAKLGIATATMATLGLASTGAVLADETTTDQPTTTLVSEQAVDQPAAAPVTETPAEKASTPSESTEEVIEAAQPSEAAPEVATRETSPETTGNDVSNQAVIDGSISNSNTTAGYTTVDWTVNTTVQGDVQAGDRVVYELTDVPAKALNGRDVTTADGTVIGKIGVETVEDNKETNAKTRADEGVNIPDTIAEKSRLTVTFTEAVNTLTNISYTLANKQVFYPMKKQEDYELPEAISVNGQNITATETIPGVQLKDSLNTGLSHETVVNTNDKGEIVKSSSDLNIISGTTRPLKAGDVLSFKLTDGVFAYDKDNIRLGEPVTVKSYNWDATTGSTELNDNGVVLYGTSDLTYKIKSVTDDKVDVEIVSISDKPRAYTVNVPTIVKDASNSDGTSIPYKTEMSINGENPYEKDRVARVQGAKLSASAMNAMAMITVKHVTKEDGRELAPSTSQEGRIGSNYTTEAKTFDQYRLTKTPDNAKGKYVKGGATVTYVYEHLRGTVIENNVSEQGEKLTDTITLKDNVFTGEAYDTTAQDKEITLKDGRSFRLVKTTDNAKGKVVEGTTEVINTYKELKGTVIENNVSEQGEKLTETITLKNNVSTGVSYDTTAQDKEITLKDGRSFRLVKTTDNAKGKVVEGTTEVINTYKELKGTVLIKYVDTKGYAIKPDVLDTPESSTGKAYDTTDHKPTTILVTNKETKETKVYTLKEVSPKFAKETGKVVAGQTIVTYVYEESAITPVKEVLDKNGKSLDSGQALVGDVLTFVLDGAPVSDGIDGGLWQYDLSDLLDTTKLKFTGLENVKVKAGKSAKITLPDGKVLKAGDDLSHYVTVTYEKDTLTIKPTKEFYQLLKDNKVEDLVDIDASFTAEVTAKGEVKNSFIQVVNGVEFKSNTTVTTAQEPLVPTKETATQGNQVTQTAFTPEAKTSQAPAQTQIAQAATLPQTGERGNILAVVTGLVLAGLGLAGIRQKKESH